MINAQNVKYVSLTKPSSIATNATASATFSRAGYDYATILLHLDSAAVSSVISTLEVSESDGTTYTTIAAFVGGGSGGFTLPTPDSSNPQIVAFNVDCRGRKKNLKVRFEGTTTARIISSMAILSRANIAPASASDSGAATLVNG